MRRILYLWVPHLHTQVEQNWDAALKGQPVIIAAGRFQRGSVIDASPEAEAMGVSGGMTWRHAHRRCPTARFLRYERPRYAPVIEQIGAVITRFTPWAELMPGTEDEFFIDLGAGDLHEGMRLVQRLQADLAVELQLETRAALAGGKFPARTLGRAPWANDANDICNAFPTVLAALAPLSIDALWELKPQVRQHLLLLGIRTLGQLAAVPQRLLVEQFGPAGRWYRLLARGIDPRRVAAWQPAPFMDETLPIHDEEPTLPLLEEIVDDLAGRLSERLVYAGLYARTVTLVAHLEGGDRRFASHHLKTPAHLRRHLSETARALLARINASPFRALELRVAGLGTRGVLQLSIFGEVERGPALRAAVARIQDRFGEGAVRNAVQLMTEIRYR